MHGGGDDSTKNQKSIKPPDGGWGWVVVFASFMIHVIADGVTYTFGLFFIEISDHLHTSKSAASWIASIMTGITYSSGPIAGAFVNKYGCRPVSIAGSILATIGFALSYFANSVTYLYLSIGLIGGLGFGLIYLPAIVSVTTYFERRRAFATGVAVCGSGFGTFLLAPLVTYLIEAFGWRTALLITSGIIFNCTIFSALFRPLPQQGPETENLEAVERDGDGTEGNQIPVIMEPSGLSHYSTNLLYRASPCQVESTQPLLIPMPIQSQNQQSSHQGIGLVSYKEENEFMENEDEADEFIVPNSYHARSTHTATPITNFLSTQGGDTLTMSCSHPVLPSCAIGSMDSLHRSARHTKRHSLKFQGFGSDVLYENSGTGTGASGGSGSSRKRIVGVGSTTGSSAGIITSRKDIFYSGSVLNITEAQSNLSNRKQKSSAFQKGKGMFPDDSDSIENLKKPKKLFWCIKCSPELYNALRTMMDLSILRDPVFLFFAISNFLTSIGYNVPYVYLVDMAIGDERNPANSKQSAGFLLSIVGISNTLSRVILGYLSDKPWVNRLYLYNSALAICGLSIGLSSHTLDIHWLWFYASIFGITAGVYVSLTSVILVDLIGLDKLTNAFGLLLLFQGVATVVGPPIVGKLFDEFQDYRYGFWLAGGMLAFSGLMLFAIPLFQKKSKTSLGDKLKKLPIMNGEITSNGTGVSKVASSNNNLSDT